MLKGKTILMVDDEEEIVELVSMLLTMNGAKVLSAGNGKDAFELFKKNPQIDAVITDVLMPGEGCDGISLTKNIRTSSQPNSVVVMVTGFSKTTESSAENAGADAIISKPFDLDQLIQFIHDLIEKNQQVS